MLRNVIFDIGNVLMDFRWQEYMRALFDDDEPTIDSVNQAIWRHGTWASMDAGTDSAVAIEQAVNLVPTHEPEIRKAFAHAGQAMHKQRYAIPWIKELKQMGKRVFFLSNYSAFSIAANQDVLDFLPYMDGGVFSFQVRTVKPEPKIYLLLCEKYGLKAEESLFTDDMPANIETARKLGFHTVLFEGYEKTYPLIMKAIQSEDNRKDTLCADDTAQTI